MSNKSLLYHTKMPCQMFSMFLREIMAVKKIFRHLWLQIMLNFKEIIIDLPFYIALDKLKLIKVSHKKEKSYICLKA